MEQYELGVMGYGSTIEEARTDLRNTLEQLNLPPCNERQDLVEAEIALRLPSSRWAVLWVLKLGE